MPHAPLTLAPAADGRLALACPAWPALCLEQLAPVLRIDSATHLPRAARVERDAVVYDFGRAELRLEMRPEGEGLCLHPILRNTGAEMTLEYVEVLETASAAFGRPERLRLLTQNAYFGDVVGLEPPGHAASAAEPGSEAPPQHLWSSLVGVTYDRETKMALLAGFLTGERWSGGVGVEARDGRIARWSLAFDGGDLQVLPGEELPLEEALLLAGSDPHALLEQYADLVAARHRPYFPPEPPVSWCSWYPYRLGVTEERLLENARIGQARLGAHGFRIVEADLGWERDCLPNAFEENAQFPHGLQWLSDRLAAMGLVLGVWKAPYMISGLDPLAAEHPEWLIRNEDGSLYDTGPWYWEPHGSIYTLDLTHPGARAWLRAKIAGLHARGVGYFKADFIGCIGSPAAKRRHDRRIVQGGGAEAARLGGRIIREALPDALLLNCGGPELPGTGQWPLLYQCQDTGNTGVITWDFQRRNFRALATHLFKNGRWGWIQPSCLCVGLPGTLEEARLRATAAFLSGGQVDISDTLTTLPEDRWQVLLATLPPTGRSARAIDLFEPVVDPGSADYVAQCKGEAAAPVAAEHPPGVVWALPVETDWDAWTLVAVFNYAATPADQAPAHARFAIPLERLGLAAGDRPWAFEFWSGLFLGAIPAKRHNPGGYEHPGDAQELTVGDAPGVLDLAFAGPAVKLLCLRLVRPHPWVVGSSFHQSCGAELSGVRWDAATATLSGTLNRPAGEAGCLIIAGQGRPVAGAIVGDRPATLHPAANGAWQLSLIAEGPATPWAVRFG